MKRRVSIIIFALIISCLNAGISFADNAWAYAGNAEELQKALNSGAISITITSSLSGNFDVPRWIYSIKGSNAGITITPKDKSKPVFTVESAVSRRTSIFTSTADDLKFSDLTIICAGECGGIDANATTKPVTISNVTFRGIRDDVQGLLGFRPSTITTFKDCTFENLNWGVHTVDGRAEYDIKIQGCTFKNVSQALSMNATRSSAKASFTNCNGDDVGYWVLQHGTGNDIMYVDVDQSTIESFSGSDYYHKIIDALDSNNTYNSRQLYTLIEDLDKTFKALPEGAKNLIIREQSRNWDNIRVYAMTELGRKMRAIDFSGDDKKAIDECLELYALLASAPLAKTFGIGRSVADIQLLELLGETIQGIISDKNLVRPMIYGFTNPTELAPFAKTAARISWGSSGNVREALCRVKQNPDRIFRANLHRLQDWLTALDEARKNLQELKNMAGRKYDYSYIAEMDKTLRAVYDFGISVNRFSAAIFFDLPVDVLFAVNYAKVTAESNQSKIIGICRELGPVYSVSQRLCVLNRTQTMRNELLKVWKDKLADAGWLSTDYSKYEELVASLSTDPDLMRDAERIKDFFREWR